MADLTFMMGKFAAVLPGELRYCRNHMWVRPGTDGTHRFGFSAYAIRLMQDVYFLDWCVNAGDAVALKQQIGNIETSKAVSDLFAPIAGTLLAFNQELLKDQRRWLRWRLAFRNVRRPRDHFRRAGLL